MSALDDFDVTLTLCFTPEHRGLQPHHTSPPQAAEEYAEFCARIVGRYVPGSGVAARVKRDLAAHVS
jgi:beta-xylosidase